MLMIVSDTPSQIIIDMHNNKIGPQNKIGKTHEQTDILRDRNEMVAMGYNFFVFFIFFC